MRIAVYHNLPSGGAKRTLFEEIKRLSLRHKIDVFSLSSADHLFADIRPYATNHEIFKFKPLPLLSSPLGRLNQIIRLVDLLRIRLLNQKIAGIVEQNEYDFLLAHPCQVEKSPSILRYLERIPSIYYCHEPLRILYEEMPERPYDQKDRKQRRILNKIDPLPMIYFNVLRQIDQQNIRCASKVLVNSRFTQEAVRRIYRLKSSVSYHGVDVGFFRKLHIEKQNIVLSVGSLTPLKGFDFLIQVMAIMPSSQRPALVIASNFQNPHERTYLEKLALKNEVNLHLIGNVNDEKLVQLYNQAKLTLYAPIREPFGLVPLESMACSTPVVAVREGGIPETIVHERTGILVERDLANFAQAVQHLLSHLDTAMKYGQNSRDNVIKNWTWDKAIKNLESHFVKILEGV